MSEGPEARRRATGIAPDPEPPPEGGLVVVLWVLAVPIFVLEAAWWWAGRIYS
jgi:hypothetical protein